MQRVQQQLHADEPEDHRQAVRQVDQPVEQFVDQEVQLPQTQQRERGRGEHDVGLLGEPVDRRDRVEREQDVGAADDDHHQQHRRHHATSVDAGEQLVAVVLVGGVEQLLGDAADDVVGVVFVGALGLEHVTGGEQQHDAEEVERPAERVDHRGAEEDEDRAGDERDRDADEQHLLLVGAGHLEAAHDHQEHEEVVDAQRLLGDVAGEVVAAVAAARDEPEPDAEQQGDADVQRRPGGRFAQRGFVCLAHVEEEVEQEQADDRGDGQGPGEWGDGQQGSLVGVGPRAGQLSQRTGPLGRPRRCREGRHSLSRSAGYHLRLGHVGESSTSRPRAGFDPGSLAK